MAEVGDRPARFSVATGNEVDAICTHPSVWGGGAGRALLAETLAAIAAGGHEELRHKLAL